MRNKKIFILVAVLLVLLLAVQASAEVKKIKSIGQFTFARVRGKIPTPEVMKMLVDRYAADIKTGFELAGYGDLYQPFIDQLNTAQFEDTTWNPGDTVKWMLFRSQGKVKVSGELEWAGRKPVEVFAVKVKVGFKTYTFIIPKPCGNIALKAVVEEIPEAICSLNISPAKANLNDPITVDMSGTQYAKAMRVDVFDKDGNKVASKDLTPEIAKWQTKFDKPGEYLFKGVAINFADKASTNPCEGKVYINYPPVGQVVPKAGYAGGEMIFDASGITDPDGKVTKVVFELKDENGQVVDSYVATQQPFIWKRPVYKEGKYTVNVTAYDDSGGVAVGGVPVSGAIPTAGMAKTIKVSRKDFFRVVEGGPMLSHGSTKTYFYPRVGMFLWINPDKLSMTFTSGAGLPLADYPWKATIMTEMLGNYHFGKFYFGFGPGFTTKDQPTRKNGVDVVSQLGYTYFNNYLKMCHVYFEFRLPIGRSFNDHYKLGLGFRYNF